MVLPGINNYAVFLFTGILLNLVPGNDTIYIISRTISQGKKAGLYSVFGIGTGSLIHTTLAAFGLSIIISKSLLVYSIIRYAGAVYLIFLGVKMIRNKNTGFHTETVSKKPLYIIYYQAILTNVLNPKVALFFISFLPQFIDLGYSRPYLSFMILGLTFTITGTLWCSMIVLFASYISAGLKRKGISAILDKLCGGTLIVLGIKVAVTSKG